MHRPVADPKPVVWTIASSDSGGGAGIQADLHTFNALGCHGCSVIAAITAQNSTDVLSTEAVSPAIFIAQLNCLLNDLPPKAIKIGLIPDVQLLQQLVLWLAEHKAKHRFSVIADPVLSSSTGVNFASEQLISNWQQLLPLLDLITPNLPELALLSGMPDAPVASQALLLTQAGAAAVLAKGGHNPDSTDITDCYISDSASFGLTQPRITTANNHGTGCVLSSAIAVACAHGYPLHDALIVGRAYLQQALAQGYPTGKGAGCLQHHSWPIDYRYFPKLHGPGTIPEPLLRFASMAAPIGLYPIVDSVQWLKRLLPLEPDVIQLRIKLGSASEIEQQVAQAVQLSNDYKLRLFINDHWQLAIKYGAYGVHLGQQDLNEADLPAIAAAGLRLGISTHSYAELLRARQLGPSYIALGHIFATQTKQMPSRPQGLQRLVHYAALCRDIPTVAIGGIDMLRLQAVVNCGVDGVAVVSAITAQTDPEHAFVQLKNQFQQYKVESRYAHNA
ncbi:hypothetical protein WG68_18240 [Arsukibacterium ikkense]|uniref:Thiamine-phosphate synthase n=1 Tax=Arsukibacterium ikkense TaxID=336831 RepID=A0A0M2UZH0_9GAMM|nr:thiamine phosphate synthase [Arsukibacterium ikkense]KKO43947.1 hypothetical protein WG68_18240 [Arsukibacterium ikkense]